MRAGAADRQPSLPKGLVCLDGRLMAAAEAQVSGWDRSFLYGDNAFEVMRTYGGNSAFEQQAHLARLERSCQRLSIGLPCSLEQLTREVATTIEAVAAPECYVRVAITRGAGPPGLSLSSAGPPRRMVYAAPLSAPGPELYRRGIAAVTRAGAHGVWDPSAGAKTGNYLSSILALEGARAQGAQEVIFLGDGGEAIEGASSNLFAVKGRALLTPSERLGLLPGVTRRVVCELAATDLHVAEGLLFPCDLYGADELFITSSVRELAPIVRLDDRPISGGRPGPVFQSLLERYRARARHP